MSSRPLRKAPGKGFGMYPDSVFNLQEGEELHPQLIKQARKSGQLNLSNRGMVSVPDKVWKLMDLTDEEQKTLSRGVSLQEDVEDNWWEHVDLTKLILASNKISTISPQVANLIALTTLDIHDNQLESLPEEIGALTNLKKLNASHNRLTCLPDGLCQLKELRSLQLNNNSITHLNDNISELTMLVSLDLSTNQLTSLPVNIGYLTQLSSLVLSSNKLESLPAEMASMRGLTTLDLNKNKLKSVPDEMKDLSKLELLYLRNNQLCRIPCLRNCVNIKELQLGSNQIQAVTQTDIENIPNVRILDLRENKITSLPDGITGLQVLERLDISRNDLSTLPYTLGTLPHLKTLQVEGNPMKSIRRDIVARGTVELLKFLRSRLGDDQLAELSKTGNISPVPLSGSPPVPDKFTMKTAQAVNLAKKGLLDIPQEAIDNGIEAQVNAFDASKNQLSAFPPNIVDLLPLLHELNLGSNKIPEVPSWINMADRIQFIEMSNNKLASLPDTIGELKHLREICLSFNQFTQIPSGLYKCPKLETILIANNQVKQIEVEQLAQLERLAVLDLQNNAIDHVPPQLGNLSQIRALQLEGNMFRMPRPTILAQGTSAVMAYLRDRIPK